MDASMNYYSMSMPLQGPISPPYSPLNSPPISPVMGGPTSWNQMVAMQQMQGGQMNLPPSMAQVQ